MRLFTPEAEEKIRFSGNRGTGKMLGFPELRNRVFLVGLVTLELDENRVWIISVLVFYHVERSAYSFKAENPFFLFPKEIVGKFVNIGRKYCDNCAFPGDIFNT